ncbi:MAG: amidase [Chromatocurvus sp.]
MPASYCGAVGFKPSVGCIPTAGVVPVSWTLDHIGPLAAHVVDVALGFAGMCGSLTPDHHALRPRQELDQDALAGLVIGDVRGWHDQGCEPAVHAARDAAVSRLLDLGAEVSPVELPHARLATTAAWIITVCEFGSIHADQRACTVDYTDAALDRLTTGAVLSASDYIRALRIRWMLQARFARIFERFDLLLTPGAPMAAPRLSPDPDPVFFDGDRMWMQSVSRNFIGQNLIGGPALVVPAGVSDMPSRPVSVQLIGAHGADDLVLSVASALAASLDTPTMGGSVSATAAPPAGSGF